MFGGSFVVSQLAEYAGDTIHNPDVEAIPHGSVIALGLGISALSTIVFDRLAHKRNHNQ